MAKRSPASRPCPCGSGTRYGDCCRPFHGGEEPEDPERLVRSRFSAFTSGDGAYLWRTLHPRHDLRARDRAQVVRELSRARQTFRYRELLIHDVELRNDEARVLFTAVVFSKGKDRSFVELSRLSRTDAGWRYLEGVVRPVAELGAEPSTIAAFERAYE